MRHLIPRENSLTATALSWRSRKRRAAREAADDPRPSLQERYADATAYATAVRDCAATLQRDRLLLAEDAERYVRDAAG